MTYYPKDPFIDTLPKLDLHGEYPDTIEFLIKDFLKSNCLMGKHKVTIVHGRHGGVLKKRTHECLKKNPLVDRFYIYGMNDGITVVELTSLSNKKH